MINNEQLQALFTPDYVSGIFQKATKSSFVMANATRLRNMTGKTMELNILSELPMAYWTDYDIEHRKLTQLSLQGKTIIAKEIAVLVPISKIAIADQSVDIEALVQDKAAEAVGKVIDETIVFGKNKPRGFREGVVPTAIAVGATVTQNGTLYEAIDKAMSYVEESDYEPNGIVGGLGLKSAFRNMTDTTGQPITGTEIDSMPKTFLNNGAWDKKVAKLIVGDWKQVYYSIRQEMEVEVFTEATIKDPTRIDSNGNPIEYNLAQQRMIAIMLTMRLGWEIPNPISVETETNNPINYFPFAIVASTGSTVPNSLTLTLKVTSDGTTPIAGADVFVGGIKRVSDETGSINVKVQPKTSYPVDVWADGYFKHSQEVAIASADKEVTLSMKEYPRYYGLSKDDIDVKEVAVPESLRQTSTDKDVKEIGKGTDSPTKPSAAKQETPPAKQSEEK